MLRLLGLGLLLCTALGSVGWAQGSAKFDGQYRGELTLTKEIKENCTEPPLGALYPLRISRARFGLSMSRDSTRHYGEGLMGMGFSRPLPD